MNKTTCHTTTAAEEADSRTGGPNAKERKLAALVRQMEDIKVVREWG